MAIDLKTLTPGAASASSVVVGAASTGAANPSLFTTTGSGNVVLSTSPTLVTPALGTPASGDLANCTFPTLNQSTTGTASNVTGTVAVANGGTGLTSLTAGYIPFGSGTSAFGSSANLFWDTVNARLGVGMASPSYKLDISTTGAAGIRLVTGDFGLLNVNNGTVTTKIQNQGSLGVIGTETNHALAIYTNNAERLRLDASGNMLFGVSSVGTSAVKVLALGNATAPTTSPAGMGQLYVESGALKYRGSSGTVTTLGPA